MRILVEGSGNTDTIQLPLSVWPIALERSHKRSYGNDKATGLYYLLRHGPALIGQLNSSDGGSGNDASGLQTNILGGFENKASGTFSSVNGGGSSCCEATGNRAAAGGGKLNNANGPFSVVTGGLRNIAS